MLLALPLPGSHRWPRTTVQVWTAAPPPPAHTHSGAQTQARAHRRPSLQMVCVHHACPSRQSGAAVPAPCCDSPGRMPHGHDPGRHRAVDTGEVTHQPIVLRGACSICARRHKGRGGRAGGQGGRCGMTTGPGAAGVYVPLVVRMAEGRPGQLQIRVPLLASSQAPLHGARVCTMCACACMPKLMRWQAICRHANRIWQKARGRLVWCGRGGCGRGSLWWCA